MSDIKLNIESKDSKTFMQYVGPINEDSELYFAKVKDQDISNEIVFDFSKVDSVNSCGVRCWILFLRDLEQGRKVTFINCTPEIISQVNMIPSFKASAHIQSLYADYMCEECQNEELIKFEYGVDMPESPSDDLKEVTCGKCSQAMEMEEIEEDFFSWLDF